MLTPNSLPKLRVHPAVEPAIGAARGPPVGHGADADAGASLSPVEIETGSLATRTGLMPFRRLRTADYACAVAHFERLPEHQRYARFFGAASAETIARRYAEADPAALHLFGCFALGHMAGLLEVWASPRARDGALAITVDAELQGLRIGTGLARLALSVAILLQVERQTLVCAPTNVPMRRIAHRLGFTPRIEDGVFVAAIDLSRTLQRRSGR